MRLPAAEVCFGHRDEGILASHSAFPIFGSAMAVSYGKNDDFREQRLVHDAEGKLPKTVLSEFVKITWPASGSCNDGLQSVRHGNFEVGGCTGLRSRYQLKDARYSCSATGWKRTGLLP